MTAEIHSLKTRQRLVIGGDPNVDTAPDGQVMRWECYLPMPPSVNSLYVNTAHGRRKSSKYASWLTDGHRRLLIFRPPVFLGKVSVDVQASPANRRKRDLDNILKALLDLLKRHGTIQDDSWDFVTDLRVRLAGDEPIDAGMVKVTLERIGRADGA